MADYSKSAITIGVASKSSLITGGGGGGGGSQRYWAGIWFPPIGITPIWSPIYWPNAEISFDAAGNVLIGALEQDDNTSYYDVSLKLFRVADGVGTILQTLAVPSAWLRMLAVAQDASGDIYLSAGQYYAKFDSTGALLFSNLDSLPFSFSQFPYSDAFRYDTRPDGLIVTSTRRYQSRMTSYGVLITVDDNSDTLMWELRFTTSSTNTYTPGPIVVDASSVYVQISIPYSNCFLFRLDLSGNFVWGRLFGNTDVIDSMASDGLGGLYIITRNTSTSVRTLSRIDSSGATLFTKTYASWVFNIYGYPTSESVKRVGGTLVADSTGCYLVDELGRIVKIDLAGNVLWIRRITAQGAGGVFSPIKLQRIILQGADLCVSGTLFGSTRNLRFVAKMPSDGPVAGSYSWSSPESEAVLFEDVASLSFFSGTSAFSSSPVALGSLGSYLLSLTVPLFSSASTSLPTSPPVGQWKSAGPPPLPALVGGDRRSSVNYF
jgi:hypothetical protein